MKNIKLLATIILMIIAIIILSTKAEAATGTINSDTVRVRKEATTKSTILTQLDQGDKVEILEQSEGWYKVQFEEDGGKITGYISESLLDVEGTVENNVKPEEPVEKPIETEPEIPKEEIPVVNTDIPVEIPEAIIEEEKEYTLQQEIEIKILPVINSTVKTKINGNIKILEIINDWCKIENDIDTGWVRINNLKKSVVNEENETETTPVENPPTEEQSPEEVAQEPEETDINSPIIKTAYVSASSLKVRKEATTESDVIDSLVLNSEIYIIEELEGWYKIKIGGKIGYVSSKYISDQKTEETTSRGNTQREDVSETKPVEENKTEEPNSTGTTGEAVVSYAKQYLGYKYVSGGASPSTGFDCSGFTLYVFKHFGITLYRTSKDQIKNGVAVNKSDLQQGDLVIFNGESNKTIGHVGIYVGGGNFIHASNPSEGVKITALSSSYYATRYVGARRVI